MKKFISSLALLCGLLLAAGARAEVVNVYTSANVAPLMLGEARGIYPDLIAWLNRQKFDNLSFRLHYLPRKRLQVKLEDGSLDGLVIGMMPQWFDDDDQKKYLWTDPFVSDRVVLVSLSSKPINPGLAASLAGRTVGVTMGYVYPGLDDWFFKSRLQRSGSISDETNIEKLLLRRVDCVLVSESAARYLIRTRRLDAKLRVYPMPGPGTERRFLVQHRHARVFHRLAPAIKQLNDDPAWRRAMAAYE